MLHLEGEQDPGLTAPCKFKMIARKEFSISFNHKKSRIHTRRLTILLRIVYVEVFCVPRVSERLSSQIFQGEGFGSDNGSHSVEGLPIVVERSV